MKLALYASTLNFILKFVCAIHHGHRNPTIETPLGFIQGSIMKSRLNKNIFSFRGVRYAEPPIRELRFKMAIPVKPWNNTHNKPFDATQTSPHCHQPNEKMTSEDCLRLDIYSPKILGPLTVGKPVIVYFGHGTFQKSTTKDFAVGPEYLLDHKIVFVVVNYRLGALGFLSTGDKHAPGNLGLKDQVVALRWIKKFIAYFGGNPNCVTIMGHGAGAWSVSLHLVSPMSRGLFHRAIAMSGSAMYQNTFPHNQKYYAEKQAKLVGCLFNSSETMMECLMTKNAIDISKSWEPKSLFHHESVQYWSPVIEPKVKGIERFLADQPANLVAKKKFHRVPLLAGVTENETARATILPIELVAFKNYELFEEIDTNWSSVAPKLFLYESESLKTAAISTKFKKFYFRGNPITLNLVNRLAQMYTDSVVFQVHKLVRLISWFSSSPVFYYKFSYKGKYTYSYWTNETKYAGVSHEDELPYLLHDPERRIICDNTTEDLMVKRMTLMWTNFAKYGRPIPHKNDSFLESIWPLYRPKNRWYMNIGNELIPRRELFQSRMKKWEQNFPINFTYNGN